jgi:hypothetical protein
MIPTPYGPMPIETAIPFIVTAGEQMARIEDGVIDAYRPPKYTPITINRAVRELVNYPRRSLR